MNDETLLTFVSDITSAHVGNNTVQSSEIPTLITSIYSSLRALGTPAHAVEEKQGPAVSIRSSVKPDTITCLECGAKMTMIKRHLSTEHHLTAAEYKARWGLANDYPLIAPDYSAKRRDIARTIGLGRKQGAKMTPPAKKKPGRPPRPKVAAPADESPS